MPPDDPIQQTVQSKQGQVVPVGIGVVVPAYKIIELLEIEELKKLRENAPPVGAKMTATSNDVPNSPKPSSKKNGNPNQKEDFNRLLDTAVKKPEPDDQI